MIDWALNLLLQGKGQEYGRLVISVVHELPQSMDLAVLAQISMAYILDSLPVNERSLPILASPHLALEQVKSILDKKSNNILFDKGEF